MQFRKRRSNDPIACHSSRYSGYPFGCPCGIRLPPSRCPASPSWHCAQERFNCPIRSVNSVRPRATNGAAAPSAKTDNPIPRDCNPTSAVTPSISSLSNPHPGKPIRTVRHPFTRPANVKTFPPSTTGYRAATPRIPPTTPWHDAQPPSHTACPCCTHSIAGFAVSSSCIACTAGLASSRPLRGAAAATIIAAAATIIAAAATIIAAANTTRRRIGLTPPSTTFPSPNPPGFPPTPTRRKDTPCP